MPRIRGDVGTIADSVVPGLCSSSQVQLKVCCSEASWEVCRPLCRARGWTLHIQAHSLVKLFLQIILPTADGNGNKVKWSEKPESLTFLSSGGHLPVHCRRNNQVRRSSFPEKVNLTYRLCMISVGIDYH